MLLAGLLLGLGLIDSGFAQEADPPAAQPGAGDAEAGEEPSGLERLIYLPYRNLKDVFESHGSTVFMSYREYVRRWREQDAQSSARTPVEAVITESHYTARVDKSLLRIDAELTVQVLGKPWVELPVKFGKAAVGKLTVADGAQILLRGTGNGSYALLFGTAGEHKVQLELAVPIQTSPDGRQAAFDVPPVGVTTFELAVPEADQTVQVSPQLISIPVDSADDETRIKANLGSTTSISANWHPRTSRKPDMDLLAAVRNSQKISIRDGLVHTDVWLEYEILRGEMEQVSIAIPNDHRILGVTSGNARIRGFKTEPGEQHQTTVVDFLTPVTGKVTIEVHTEHEFETAESIGLVGKTDEGDYLGIHSVGSVRESGVVTVTSAGDLSLQYDEVVGLGRIEIAEVPQTIRQPNGANFKFYSSDIRLSAVANAVEPRLTVNSIYRYTFQDDELEVTTQLDYTIERAGVFEINVNVPDGLEIDDVRDTTGGTLVREFHVEGEDEKTLRIVLQSRTASEAKISLTIEGHVEFADASDSIELSLPIPEPTGIEREVAQVFVLAEDALEVITSQDDVTGAQPRPLTGIGRQGRHRVASGWTFNRRPVEIPVKTERRPTRLTAAVATTVNVKEESVELSSVITFNVQFAGIDTFRLAVPESVSEKVNIESLEGGSAPDIQQQVADEEAQDGWITHTIRMQRDVTGSHRFQITWDLGTDDEDAAGSNREIVIEPVRVLGLEQTDDTPEVALSDIRGEVVVQKDRSLSVAAEALDETIEAIDVRELQLVEPSGAIAFRYFRQPVGVKIEATKHQIQKVIETVVMRSLVEIVARDDPEAGYRCRYLIKSSERQRLRVDVPPASELLGVFIDGHAVNPERNTEPGEAEGTWDSYFINVSRESASDIPFGLVIQMMTPIAKQDQRPFEGVAANPVLRLPQIGGANTPGVAVQELNTVIWVPEEFELVGDADGFVNETKLTPENAMRIQPPRYRDWLNTDDWVGVEPAGFIDFPTEGNRFRYSNLGGAVQVKVRAAHRASFTWLLSGAILVFALILRNISWDHKLLMVLIIAFVGALAALSAQGWVTGILAASRFGIYALVLIWLLHSIFTWRSKRPAATDEPSSGGEVVLQGASGTPAVIPPPGVFDDLREQFGK